MDHRSLAKQDKKHVGVSNYNQVKRELIKGLQEFGVIVFNI